MNEYNIKVKIRNNLILKVIKDAGFEPGSKLSDLIGIKYYFLNDLINLTLSPLDENGNLRPGAIKVLEFFNKSPDELWTLEQLIPFEKNSFEFEADISQIQNYLPKYDPIELLEHEDRISAIDEMLEKLTPRESDILRKRFGIDSEAMTLDAIGKTGKPGMGQTLLTT